MNSQQYEELCRYFLAEILGISSERIRSAHIPNPKRPGLPEYKHQIDLCWETETELGVYLHVANAKWRGTDKVDQPEVLLLQQVKQKVAAHKALMLTSQGYTAGAIAIAKDEGIALHIVKPSIELTHLPTQERSAIQAKLQEIADSSAKPIFLHKVVHRAFDFSEVSPHDQCPGSASSASDYHTRAVTGHRTRLGGTHSHRAGSSGGRKGASDTRGGGPIKRR